MGRSGPYGRPMSEDYAGPAITTTLDEWLKARDETRRHLDQEQPPHREEWVQRLADLLTTERSWQDQYTELIAIGRTGGRFPSSNR